MTNQSLFFKDNIFLIKVLANAALTKKKRKSIKTKQNSLSPSLNLTIFYLNPIADDEND